MNHPENLKILAFVGLTGSGKSTAVEHFTQKGYPKVYFGGIIYEAMKEAGVEKGEANEKQFRVDIRKREGEDFIVKRIIKQIEDLAAAGQHRIIADGIYTWAEYTAMKHAFHTHMTVVAIVAPKHKRYQRLEQREDRPQTPEISAQRDYAEIETLQKGGPIAMADFYAANSESIEALGKDLDTIAEQIDF